MVPRRPDEGGRQQNSNRIDLIADKIPKNVVSADDWKKLYDALGALTDWANTVTGAVSQP